jgi:fatty-acyl-CoA synthase
MGALPTLLKGATLVLEERFEPGRTLELIEAEQITNLSGVPTTFQMLSDHPRWAVTDLSSLRRITCGGSTIPKRVCLAFEARGLAFTSGYGMTEAAPGATSLSAEHSRAKADSSGLPHFFSRVRVIGVSGESLEVGEIGEVHVGGPNVIREYWGRESAADSFEDGWFRSGDLGYLDAEGFLVITGRVKDMIISGGENIYPIEVERLVDEIPGVRASAVIGVPDPVWGEVPVAVVELVAGASLDVETLRTALSGRLARFKIPRAVIVVDELPRTASGKVRKVELRGQFPTAPSFPETSI